jgi:hypothetical protein
MFEPKVRFLTGKSGIIADHHFYRIDNDLVGSIAYTVDVLLSDRVVWFRLTTCQP